MLGDVVLTRLGLAQGITAYQTDYSMAALAIRAEGSPLQPADGSAFKLPMASLDGKPGRVPLRPLGPLVSPCHAQKSIDPSDIGAGV